MHAPLSPTHSLSFFLLACLFLLLGRGAPQVFSQKNFVFRTTEALKIDGVFFSTYFGGNDASWATPKTTVAYVTNFEVTSPNAVAAPMQPAVKLPMQCNCQTCAPEPQAAIKVSRAAPLSPIESTKLKRPTDIRREL